MAIIIVRITDAVNFAGTRMYGGDGATFEFRISAGSPANPTDAYKEGSRPGQSLVRLTVSEWAGRLAAFNTQFDELGSAMPLLEFEQHVAGGRPTESRSMPGTGCRG
jgi:hypothetical protein